MELSNHTLYQSIRTQRDLQIFMESHVFAVWDFMSLLKSLQRKVSCVEVPWKPSPYPREMTRLINEIVIGEECDIDPRGRPLSHFELYLQAMEEVGASTAMINDFLGDLDHHKLPAHIKHFVSYNLELAREGSLLEVAAVFFYGREKLIPEMFSSILSELQSNKLNCPSLLYYLQRHIELDGDDHGPKAQAFLNFLITTDEDEQIMLKMKNRALIERELFWNGVLEQIQAQ